jgi:hypothetical protein
LLSVHEPVRQSPPHLGLDRRHQRRQRAPRRRLRPSPRQHPRPRSTRAESTRSTLVEKSSMPPASSQARRTRIQRRQLGSEGAQGTRRRTRTPVRGTPRSEPVATSGPSRGADPVRPNPPGTGASPGKTNPPTTDPGPGRIVNRPSAEAGTRAPQPTLTHPGATRPSADSGSRPIGPAGTRPGDRTVAPRRFRGSDEMASVGGDNNPLQDTGAGQRPGSSSGTACSAAPSLDRSTTEGCRPAARL